MLAYFTGMFVHISHHCLQGKFWVRSVNYKYVTNINTSIVYGFRQHLYDNDLLLFVKGEKKWPNEVPSEIIELLEEYILSEAFRK